MIRERIRSRTLTKVRNKGRCCGCGMRRGDCWKDGLACFVVNCYIDRAKSDISVLIVQNLIFKYDRAKSSLKNSFSFKNFQTVLSLFN